MSKVMRKVLKGTRDIKVDKERHEKVSRAYSANKAGKVARVLKGSANVRQIRCKKCNNLTGLVPDKKGGYKNACLTCGQEYKVTPM